MIAQRFSRILKRFATINHIKENFDKLNQLLFGSKTELQDSKLPLFQIDTASKGQAGVEQIKKALEEGDPYALALWIDEYSQGGTELRP